MTGLLWTAALLTVALLTAGFLYWRVWFYFRDPPRSPPPGDHLILAPADGYVTYVKSVRRGEVPIAIKHRRAIPLTELIATDLPSDDGYLIGIFMNPFSVHHNRMPVSGEIVLRVHKSPHRNVLMTRMLINVLLRREDPERDCTYLVHNERLTIGVKTTSGAVVTATQIADAWINRIIARVSVGDRVVRGEKYGLIQMGSQVDTFIPISVVDRIVVTPGEYVHAGESVLAESPSSASRSCTDDGSSGQNHSQNRRIISNQ
jgi:phosphatidylserine decarboxylase